MLGKVPTQADCKAYHEDGVVCLRGLLPPDWLDFMRSAFIEALAKPGPYAEFISRDTTWDNMFQPGASERSYEMFQDQFSSHRVPSIATIVRESPAAAIIARLFGAQKVVFFYDHLILKCGGSEAPIPWHQDLPYWKIDGSQVGSVWIPLDPMPEASSVRYILGSHRWGLLRPKHFVDASPYEGTEHLPPMPDIDGMLQSGEVQQAVFGVEPGDVVAFDSRIVHGSPGNSSDGGQDHRRIALRFGGDDCTYCERPGETAIPTKEVDAIHGLKHGDPLACDAFPQVWPRS